MNKLRLIKLQFCAAPDRNVRLPEYLCGTIRGALGYSLAELGCKFPERMCSICDDYCAYYRVFKNNENIPVPYIIESDSGGMRNADTPLRFSLTLVGIACDYAETVIAAVKHFLSGGFARRKAVFRVLEIRELLCDTVIEENGLRLNPITPFHWSDSLNNDYGINGVRLDFLTPFRVKDENNLDFSAFMPQLFNRICELMQNYCGSDLLLPYRISNKLPDIKSAHELRPVSVKFEKNEYLGRAGSLCYLGDLGEYMPYIRLGELIHFGKAIPRGFGRYRIQTLNLL